MPHWYSRAVRSFVLPWVSTITHSNFWKLYGESQKDTADSAFFCSSDKKFEKLKALVHHAYCHVPFYRQRMDECGMTPDSLSTLDDFRRLPPTTKNDLTTNFPDLITASQQVFKPWRYVSTSGTVERLTVIHDFRKRDFGRAAQLLSLNTATGYQAGMKYLEIPPDICINVCGASDAVEPNAFRYFFDNVKARKIADPDVISDLRGLVERQMIYRRLQLPSFGTEGLAQKQEVLDEYIQTIDTYRPYVVKALPAYLYLLALHILDKGLKPPAVEGSLMPMGASLSPYMKQVIEAAFNRPVYEDYGSAELGAIATECDGHAGLHPFSGLFHIEVVRQGKSVGDAEIGRVLVTDLYNYAMPLIRYDIGDVALLRQDPCECGLPGDRLEIQGRLQDCLIGENGAIVTPDKVTDTFLKRSDVLGFQLELKDKNEAYLQVVPKGSGIPNLAEIEQNLFKLLGNSLNIASRTVPTILPESGGKYRFVKNLSKTAQIFI